MPIFLVSGANGMPEVVEIPKGARIQGVPLGNELPQIFQTTAAVGGRAEWNQMSALVDRIRFAPPVNGDAFTVDLEGYETSLKAGDPLLMELAGVDGPVLRTVEKAKRKKGEPQRPVPGSSVVPGRKSLRAFDEPATEVTFTEAVATGIGETRLQSAYRFSGRARLFGYDAPRWSQVPDTVRRQYAPVEGGVQCSVDDGVTWASADEGLPELEVRCLGVSGPHLFAGTTMGLYRRADADLPSTSGDPSDSANPDGWSLCSNGLGRLQVSAFTDLGEPSGDHLWVADSRGQVYQSSDGGSSFSPVQGRVEPQVAGIRALLGKGVERLAKPLHLEPSPSPRPTLPVGAVHALAAQRRGDSIDLFAGTDKGVFRFELPAGGWRATSAGLPGADPSTGQASTAVRAMLVEPSGAVLLGCDQGLFRSTDGGRHWRAVERGLPSETAVRCLEGVMETRLGRWTCFAGTANGVYLSDGPERGWRPVSNGLIDPAPDASGPPEVTALASRLDPTTLWHNLFAGTPAGLFFSEDRGESWEEVESLQPVPTVDDLAVDAVGRVLVAMPFAGFGASDWPGFHLEAGAIDLDRTYRHAVAGGWVVLRQPESVGGVTESIFRIRRVQTVARSDFELSGLVTRLVVEDDGTLVTFDLRMTQVFLGSQGLEPWRRTTPDLNPVTGSTVRISPALQQRPEGQRRMIVSGKRVRVRPLSGAWRCSDPSTAPPPPDEALPVFEWRTASPAPDGSTAAEVVRVIDHRGRRLELFSERVEWVPAKDDDEVVGQAVGVLGGLGATTDAESGATGTAGADGTVDTGDLDDVAGAGGSDATDSTAALSLLTPAEDSFTTLRLDAPLELFLDPTSVSVWGNVAPANQGQTLSRALGSGDAAQPLQHFPIDHPLTYEPAETEDGFRSTLDVEVAGARWSEVPHLGDVGPGAHAFMVRPDLAGRATVIFGDGVNGARLPTGRQNVVATYRSGMWSEPLAPHQLSILQTRPLGLRHANNPLATEPGPPPEAAGDSRRRVSSWLRPLERLVSLQDFQDFVGQNTAVSLALVAPLQVRGQSLIQVTIVGHSVAPLSPRGDLYRQLVRSIEAQRAPGPPVRLMNYRPVDWRVGFRVRLRSDADRAAVAEALRGTLEAQFGVAAATFGQRLFLGELVDAALEVDGVASATATEFGTVGADDRLTPAPAGRLVARLAFVERPGERVKAAELLRLAGVDVEVEG
ncbi:MAG: hypothetical protein AAFY88_01065 [Acidobacteriota bacterium]